MKTTTYKTAIAAGIIAYATAWGAMAEAAEATCQDYRDLGKVIMTARQSGMPLAEAVELAQGNHIVDAFVLDAWTWDRHEDPEQRTYAAFEFAHLIEAACMERGQ